MKTKYTKRPLYFLNRHFETVIPSLLFSSPEFEYDRERLELNDGDFLDLDWLKQKNDKLIILSHGMEGSTDRYYMRRMAHYFHKRDWDILAWNTRGCSGEMNRRLVVNHHGFATDLQDVMEHALTFDYTSIVFVGMSMGGNLSVKLLAENETDDRVKGAVCFSVTGDMEDMTHTLERKENWLYKSSFLKKMKLKIEKLAQLHPGEVETTDLEEIDTFEQFHKSYTVPIMKFKDLSEFYYSTSANNFIDTISKPTLMVNALNDPILGEASYPFKLAESSPYFHLETPKHGGHLGFNYFRKPYSYMEIRAEEFIKEQFNL